MKHALAISLVVALTISPSASIFAQETGSLIKRPAAQIRGTSPEAVSRTLAEFGTCVVRKYPERAQVVTRMVVTDPEYSSRLKALADEDCLSTGELSMSSSLLRGALFVALYERLYSSQGRIDFSGLASPDYLKGYTQPLAPEAVSVIAIARFGECVARKEGANSVQFLNSLPGSSSEETLVRGLTPSFSACIPAGQTLRLSRQFVRSAVAEGVVGLLRNEGQN
jgi:hypothetical protein